MIKSKPYLSVQRDEIFSAKGRNTKFKKQISRVRANKTEC